MPLLPSVGVSMALAHAGGMSWRLAAAMATACFGAACQIEPTEAGEVEASDSAATGDEDVGVPAAFDRNHVVDDDFYQDESYATVAQLQRFLEETPHKGVRSWLADAKIGDRPA